MKDVVFDGVLTEFQRLCDLAITQSFGDHGQPRPLPDGVPHGAVAFGEPVARDGETPVRRRAEEPLIANHCLSAESTTLILTTAKGR